MDLKKVISASSISIGAGLLLVLLTVILLLFPLLLPDSLQEIMSIVNLAFFILKIPIFFGLFFWTGFRAVKKFGFDAVGAGGVAAFAYFVCALVELFVNFILSLLVSVNILGPVAFKSMETTIAATVFSSTAGPTGILFSLLCGIGIMVIGVLLNFAVGAVGALIGGGSR